MPSQYRLTAPRLKVEIVGRVAGGERLAEVCAQAGMPGRHTVGNWARADEGFAAELAQAKVRGAWRRVCMFDDAKAAAFLARARAGETINSLLGQPGMPSRRTYRHWQATQGEFAAAIGALRERRDQHIGHFGRQRRRGFDPALADRIVVGLHRGAKLDEVLAGAPELPCRKTVRRWRREAPEFDAVLRGVFAAWRRKRATARGCTPELAERIVERIITGASFASLGREPGMPSRQTLRRWVRARPDFAAAVAQACEDREDWYRDRILAIAETATPGTLGATRRRRGQLLRHLVRLRHRPGAVHRKAGRS